jgi:hypothetical protein
MPTSRETLLRLIRGSEIPKRKTPRVLGLDDFAWKKGDRYGTLLVDLEARCPVDLLADREAASVARWLREHPGVKLISRDRAGMYAEGAKRGAPTRQTNCRSLSSVGQSTRHAQGCAGAPAGQLARGGRARQASQFVPRRAGPTHSCHSCP